MSYQQLGGIGCTQVEPTSGHGTSYCGRDGNTSGDYMNIATTY